MGGRIAFPSFRLTNTTMPEAAKKSHSSMLRIAIGVLLGLVLLYALAICALLSFQESLLFYPTKLPADYSFNKPDVVERKIPVPGAVLSALHFRQPHAKGLIFFLHGNAGNLDVWLPSTEFYRHAGYDVFMVDYRGFGKSSGHIQSEEQLHADVLAAWNSVAGEYAGRPIVLYGRSLGSGLAVKLATEISPAQLILVSPYSSFVQLGRDHFPWIPSFATRYPMRTDQWIRQVKAPILMIHGGRDTLIPLHHALTLKAIRPDAELVVVDAAGHLDIHTFPTYTDALMNKLSQVAIAAGH
jgi:uncharacterized protein